MKEVSTKESPPTAKEVVSGSKTAIVLLAERLNVGPDTLKKTLMATAFKDCKEEAQFIAAVIVANTYRLNPILKEMYAFPSKGGAVIPIVSIDGWISLVNRQESFNGVELIENEAEGFPGGLKSVTAKFYHKDKGHPIVVTEYMEECYNDQKEPWKKWPRRMLRHKAYIQGARIAFGLSGIYDPDEAERIIEAQAEEAKPGKPEVRMPQAFPAPGTVIPVPSDVRVDEMTEDQIQANWEATNGPTV
jgi:phage recombination protein Bet